MSVPLRSTRTAEGGGPYNAPTSCTAPFVGPDTLGGPQHVGAVIPSNVEESPRYASQPMGDLSTTLRFARDDSSLLRCASTAAARLPLEGKDSSLRVYVQAKDEVNNTFVVLRCSSHNTSSAPCGAPSPQGEGSASHGCCHTEGRVSTVERIPRFASQTVGDLYQKQ